MKIQIIKKAEKKSTIAQCPFIVEAMPPEKTQKERRGPAPPTDRMWAAAAVLRRRLPDPCFTFAERYGRWGQQACRRSSFCWRV